MNIIGDIFDTFDGIRSIIKFIVIITLIKNLCVKLFRNACERDECLHSRRMYPFGNNIFWQATCKPLNSLQTEGFTNAISAQWYTSGTHFQQQEYSRQIDKRAHVEAERERERERRRRKTKQKVRKVDVFFTGFVLSRSGQFGRRLTESVKRFSITIAVTMSTEKAISRDSRIPLDIGAVLHFRIEVHLDYISRLIRMGKRNL